MGTRPHVTVRLSANCCSHCLMRVERSGMHCNDLQACFSFVLESFFF
eukprot:SAG22_NODE_18697_length_282_cov_2.240437_1_plen_46_part_01